MRRALPGNGVWSESKLGRKILECMMGQIISCGRLLIVGWGHLELWRECSKTSSRFDNGYGMVVFPVQGLIKTGATTVARTCHRFVDRKPKALKKERYLFWSCEARARRQDPRFEIREVMFEWSVCLRIK